MTDTMTAEQYRDAEAEVGFQRAIIDAAERLGWTVYHHPDSRRATAKGMPDLMLVHHDDLDRPLLFFEVKSAHGDIRPEQRRFIQTARAHGLEAHVVRPNDMDRVLALLEGARL